MTTAALIGMIPIKLRITVTASTGAEYRTAKGGIKAHVSLDEASMIPEIINIIDKKLLEAM
jgi:hypothetical protein